MLFEELNKMESFNAIANVLNGIELAPLQQIDVIKMIARKRGIISYDTGLGKTVLITAAITLLQNEDPHRRFVIFVKKDQILQTPEKIERMCGKEVICSDGTEEKLEAFFQSSVLSYNIVMFTHSCFQSKIFLHEFYKIRDKFSGIIIDEAHELCNNQVANAATLLATMCTNFEYCWALTATPIITKVQQFVKLANIIDYKTYKNPRTLKSNLLHGENVIGNDPCFFINRSRADFGSMCNYRGYVYWVSPLPHQLEYHQNLFKVTKGDGAIPQAEALVELIKERKRERGLIYVNQHSVRQWILPFLEQAKIQYACINGSTKSDERKSIMAAFNVDKTLDVIITSVTEALDLDCNYVVFYEFTIKVKQMIGRAHRGLESKDLDIIFIISKGTDEEDYFVHKIYERSLFIKSILGKDCSELEQVAYQIIGE